MGRVGYYQLISGKSEKNNCFSKFSSNSWYLRVKPFQIVTFSLPTTLRKKFFRPPKFQNKKFVISFSYLVKLNDNGSYDGLREPIRKLENHYHELKIYYYYDCIMIYNRSICITHLRTCLHSQLHHVLTNGYSIYWPIKSLTRVFEFSTN